MTLQENFFENNTERIQILIWSTLEFSFLGECNFVCIADLFHMI